MARNEFATRLSALMEEKNITIREAAKLAGVSQSTLQNWRSGHLPTDYRAVQNLATALGTTLKYLLVGENGVSATHSSSLSTEDILSKVKSALYDEKDRISIEASKNKIEIMIFESGDKKNANNDN